MDYNKEKYTRKLHTHTGNLFSHEKEENPATCDNMNGLSGYGKWDTPDNERQIYCIILFTFFLDWIYKCIKTENKMVWLLGMGGRGIGEILFKGTKLQLVSKSWSPNAQNSEYR